MPNASHIILPTDVSDAIVKSIAAAIRLIDKDIGGFYQDKGVFLCKGCRATSSFRFDAINHDMHCPTPEKLLVLEQLRDQMHQIRLNAFGHDCRKTLTKNALVDSPNEWAVDFMEPLQ